MAEGLRQIWVAGEVTHRAYWPWEPEEELAMVDMRIAGKPAKAIARELCREPSSIHSRMQIIRNRFVEPNPTLRKHRQEELELLRKLLVEAQMPDCGERR